MTLADVLRQNGVKVFKGNFNSNAWTIETTDKDAFVEIAKMVGVAFHQDAPDLRHNGQNYTDREFYFCPFNGIVVRCVVGGE